MGNISHHITQRYRHLSELEFSLSFPNLLKVQFDLCGGQNSCSVIPEQDFQSHTYIVMYKRVKRKLCGKIQAKKGSLQNS